MSTALWCVLIASLLPYISTLIAKVGAMKRRDNAHPRKFLSKLTGYRQRANWAQQNAFEAFPFFAAALLASELRNEASHADEIAIAFVVCRVLLMLFYIAGKGPLRNLAFFGGITSVILIFVGV